MVRGYGYDGGAGNGEGNSGGRENHIKNNNGAGRDVNDISALVKHGRR